MSERKTGVFGSVITNETNNTEASSKLTLESLDMDSDETIYNLLFKDFDEENN